MSVLSCQIEADYLRQRQALMTSVRAIVKCPHTAEDLVQESYLRVSDATRQSKVANPAAFLFRTARNLALDKVRRLAMEARHRPPTLEDVAAAPDRQWESRQMLSAVDSVLASLSPACREAFLLHRLDGLTHKQIACKMGISASMVDKHIQRAVTACRTAISDS